MFSKSSRVIELTPKNFKGKSVIHPELKNKKGMIVFAASWCPHCVNFAPTYESIAFTLGKSFPLFYLDCEKYSDFASKNLGINGFPTVMFIDRSGKLYKKYIGDRSENMIIENICKEARVCA